MADTWAHFEGLLARLQAVCRLGAVSSWRELQAFLRDFADKAPGATSPFCPFVYLATWFISSFFASGLRILLARVASLPPQFRGQGARCRKFKFCAATHFNCRIHSS